MTAQAYGVVNGQGAGFTPALREGNDTPVAVRVTLSVPMSYEDITAAFYLAIQGGGLLSDLDDAAWARQLLFDTVANDSAFDIVHALQDIADIRPGSEQDALVEAIRAKVTEIFSPMSAPADRQRVAVSV